MEADQSKLFSGRAHKDGTKKEGFDEVWKHRQIQNPIEMAHRMNARIAGGLLTHGNLCQIEEASGDPTARPVRRGEPRCLPV